MKKTDKIFKKAIALILVAMLAALTLFIVSCSKEEEKQSLSALRGTFTSQKIYGQDKSVTVTSDSLKATSEYKYHYLFCTSFPERNAEGQPISYSIDQRLKLLKDHTYYYEYSIKLANPQDWGGNIATVNVEMSGTFSYASNKDPSDKIYTVKLSNPTAGSHTVYGAKISDAGSVYGWSLHGEPDFYEDLGYLATLPDNNFDKYTKGRTVKVEIGEEGSVLYDDVFFVDILQDICKYFNY